jgi:hypothetical protein
VVQAHRPVPAVSVGGALITWIITDMIEVGETNGPTIGFARGLAAGIPA